jgi:(E)-4-hydroxy-3-methylbut-2-enyl-diphosphate synthase
LPEIVRLTPVPLMADIHFDYRWALAAIESGFHGLRLNPGNIRDTDKVKTVVAAAKERGIPIRIGVNAGSLPPIRALADGEMPPTMVERMVEAALWEINLLEESDYDNIKISMKAFDVPSMVEANRELARILDERGTPYPLHLGVTEAGTPRAGSVRSAIGIGMLLAEGIGDTIRVSLAADPKEEVPVCYDILNTLGLRQRGATLVACPTCGRIEIDLIPLAHKVEEHFNKVGKPITVAVMGCVVNGPGEAKMADLGIAGGKGRGVIFRKGEVIRNVDEPEFMSALIEEGDRVIAEMEGQEAAPRNPDDVLIPLTSL